MACLWLGSVMRVWCANVNRCQSGPSALQSGVPLLEIVSEPDMRTGVEAAAYAAELRRIMLFFGITDGNMQASVCPPDAMLATLSASWPSWLLDRYLCSLKSASSTWS